MADNVPEIHDKTPQPLTFLQEKRGVFIVAAAIAVLVILTVPMLRQKPVVAPRAAGAPQENKPPTPEQIKAFSDQIQRDTQQLAVQQQREEMLQQQAKATLSGQPLAGPQTYPPGTTTGQYTPAAAAATKRHESNVVLSFRGGAANAAAPSKPASAEDDLRALIADEKQQLAQNIAQTEAISRAPAAPPVPPTFQPPASTKPKEPSELQAATGKMYRLFEGTLIETTLVNRLNGSFTGPVEVMVTTPVYSHDQQHILIAQGTRVNGTADRVGVQGQQRLAVSFHRMVMPDGFVVDLDKFTGLNQIGETGLKDKVDHHYFDVFGTSIALGLVQGFSLVGTGSALTAGGFGQYREGVANSIGQSSYQVLGQRLNILPTITIREGHRVRILLAQDLEIPAYENHRVPGDL